MLVIEITKLIYYIISDKHLKLKYWFMKLLAMKKN